MNIAKLKGLMAERGKTQEDLAKLLEITITGFSLKLKDPNRFRFNEIVTIAKYFDVDINIFLN